MLRLDDLAVRTAELNRRADAINRYGWRTACPTGGRTATLGPVLRAVRGRLARNAPIRAGHGSPIVRSAA